MSAAFTPAASRTLHGGTQRLYRFENGYGASVISHSFSYGTELAVIKYTGDGADQYGLVYDTPITDDVMGHLTEADVHRTLELVSSLTSEGRFPAQESGAAS